jgi:hypothetical protein
LGFNCIQVKQHGQTNNVSGLNEFVWFEHSTQDHDQSSPETQQNNAPTGINFEDVVWFEDSFSDREISGVQNSFGVFDFGMEMSEGVPIDQTTREFPPKTFTKPMLAEDDQPNSNTEDYIENTNKKLFSIYHNGQEKQLMGIKICPLNPKIEIEAVTHPTAINL